MKVRVRYLGLVRSKIGKREEEFQVKEGSTLSDLLDAISEEYAGKVKGLFDTSKESTLDPTFIVTVNGVLTGRLRGVETPLKDGDEVALMTLISGG